MNSAQFCYYKKRKHLKIIMRNPVVSDHTVTMWSIVMLWLFKSS